MAGLPGRREMDHGFKAKFPTLQDVARKQTSPPSNLYNCIAWAFKDTRRVWWPNNRRAYWPIRTSPNSTTMNDFERLFVFFGWEETESREVDPGYEKIALYAL